MKNRSVNILIVSLLLLALLSVMLIVLVEKAHDDFDKGITVSANGVTESLIKVRDLKLNPTESKEYDVNLICLASGKYNISLDYETTADGGMQEFVNVTVTVHGEAVYEGGLKALLDGEIIHFEGELFEEDPLTVTIRYEMPESVGNEAQGTFVDFDVKLTVEKK